LILETQAARPAIHDPKHLRLAGGAAALTGVLSWREPAVPLKSSPHFARTGEESS